MSKLDEALPKANKATLDEVLRQAESLLGAQLTAAIAADQRAMSFVSLMAAATVVLIGGGVSLLTADRPHIGLGWVALIVSGTFLTSMLFAIWSARSIKWSFAGSSPDDWIEDLDNGLDLEGSHRLQASNYAFRISKNETRMEAAAGLLAKALWVAWFGLLFGVVATVGLILIG